MAQTSLVLDAKGRALAALHGPVELAVDLERGCLPNRFTPAAEVASVVYLKVAAPDRTCREPPTGRSPGWSRRWSGVPVARAAGWLEEAGLSLVQRLRVDDAARATAEPGRVWRSEPAPGSQAAAGGRVRLWVSLQGCPSTHQTAR